MKFVTFDTPIKEIARQEELEFLEENIPNLGKQSQDVTVACFPYTSPDKALEVTDVLDRTGITRGNIIGIERDRERYEFLARQNLGIALRWGQARDFYSQHPGQIDIILNDFQGEFSEEVLGILRNIAGRQVLSSNSILLLNIFGQREFPQIKRNYRLADTNPFTDNQFKKWLERKHPEKARNFNFSMVYSPDPTFFDLYRAFRRDVGITRLALSVIHQGRNNLYVPSVYLRNPQFREINQTYQKRILRSINLKPDLLERDLNGKAYFVDETGRKIFVAEEVHDRDRPSAFSKEVLSLMKQYCLVADEGEFYNLHNESLRKQLAESGLDPDLLSFLIIYSNRPYFLRDYRRVMYGRNMHLDMYSLTQHEDALEDAYRHLDISERNGGLRFRINENGRQAVGEALRYLASESEKTSFTDPVPRERLEERRIR